MEHKGPARVHDPGIAVIRQELFGKRRSKVQRSRNLVIGRDAIIAAGAVVMREIPPFCAAARLLRDRRAPAEPGPPPDTTV